MTKYNKEYYIKNRDFILNKRRLKYKENCEKHKDYLRKHSDYYKLKAREWMKAHPERGKKIVSKSARKQYNRHKDFLFSLLGTICKSCGLNDIRVLHFDHIKNDGYNDRKRFRNGNQLLRYYCNHPQEALEKLQTLCANCNWIKRYEAHNKSF